MTRDRLVGLVTSVLIVAALFVAVTVGRGDARQAVPMAQPTATLSATSAAVSSHILGTGLPLAAPGHTLYLYRVTVVPGGRIPPHTHPGTQVASIVAGELTYTVLRGEVQLTRAASNGTPGPVERPTSGQEVVLRPGDAVVEHAGMVHQARNHGTVAMIIFISSFFPSEEPMSRPADPAATPAAATDDRAVAGDLDGGRHSATAGVAPAVENRRRRPYHVSGQYGAAEASGRQLKRQCVRGHAAAFPSTGAACLALVR